MKRKVLILTAVFTILFVVVSSASILDDIDLASLNTDLLLELRDKITQELYSRGEMVNDRIASGDYVAGKTIKPGYYILAKENDGMGGVYIYDSEEMKQKFTTSSACNIWQGDTVTVNLQEGMVMSLNKFEGTIVENEKPSWAP